MTLKLVSAGLIALILLEFVSPILRDPVPSRLLQCALKNDNINIILLIGVPNAAGIAQVKLDFNPSRSSGKWKVCIETNVIGFTPGLLHIHKGKISENGGVSVDFTSLLSGDPVFDGCVAVTQSVVNDMKLNPVRQPGARPTIMALLHPYDL